jgi:hypothetical protein
VSGLVEDLAGEWVGSGTAISLAANPRALPFAYSNPGTGQALVRPILQVGRDVWIWLGREERPGGGDIAGVLDELARRHPAQSLHVLLHPFAPWGQVRAWGLDIGAWPQDSLYPEASRLVLGEGSGEWEAVGWYLKHLSAQCELFGDLRQRGFWRNALAASSFRTWLISAVQERIPAGEAHST